MKQQKQASIYSSSQVTSAKLNLSKKKNYIDATFGLTSCNFHECPTVTEL